MFHREYSKVRVLGNNEGELYHLVYNKLSCKIFFAHLDMVCKHHKKSEAYLLRNLQT